MRFFAIHADFGSRERSECIHCGSQENDFRASGILGYRYKGIFLTRIDVCLIFSWLLDYILSFAGRDDDLVDRPQSLRLVFARQPGSEISVNQSLLELRGHTGSVYALRFDPCNDVLASAAGREKIIRLWTPIAQ